MLNTAVRLPSSEYWAKPKTVNKEWGETAWYNPGRTIANEKVGFFITTTKKAGVREQLFGDENIIETSFERKKQYMSYSDASRLPTIELEADHLQASAIILQRQKELVEAMNVDPLFRQSILAQGDEHYYFMADPANPEKIVGTKNFYMEYHNCVDNLWLLRRSDNCGKSAEECTDFMKKSDVYNRFLEQIGGEEKSIKDNRSSARMKKK